MRYIRRLAANRLAALGAIAIVLLVVTAVFAPWLVPHDPDQINSPDRFAPPLSGTYLLGADELGRDLLSRIIFGSRASLAIGVSAVVAASLLGGSAGIISGYFGGWVDGIIMRVVDVLFAIPMMMIALSVVGMFGRAEVSLIFALALGFAPSFARVSYSTVVSIRDARFVEASRAMGASPWRILRQDVFPNILPLLSVQMTIFVARAIIAEAGLGFLGLGVMPPTPSWGQMLSLSRQYFNYSWAIAIFPGLAILIAVFAFNLFGDGLRDLLDPRAWQAGE